MGRTAERRARARWAVRRRRFVQRRGDNTTSLWNRLERGLKNGHRSREFNRRWLDGRVAQPDHPPFIVGDFRAVMIV